MMLWGFENELLAETESLYVRILCKMLQESTGLFFIFSLLPMRTLSNNMS